MNPALDSPAASAIAPSAQRSDLQLGRRLVHAANGVAIGAAYALFFTHLQVVHAFGIIACVVYVLDRVRIHYPELLARTPWVNRYFFRAEEQFRESAMIPYAIATLLTILTFPKPVALTAIWTLALADPLSAIVGIRWGRHPLLPNRTLEGSLAFFGATLAVALVALVAVAGNPWWSALGPASLIALASAGFDLVPVRIDDNLTIPLFVGFTGWAVCVGLGLGLG